MYLLPRIYAHLVGSLGARYEERCLAVAEDLAGREDIQLGLDAMVYALDSQGFCPMTPLELGFELWCLTDGKALNLNEAGFSALRDHVYSGSRPDASDELELAAPVVRELRQRYWRQALGTLDPAALQEGCKEAVAGKEAKAAGESLVALCERLGATGLMPYALVSTWHLVRLAGERQEAGVRGAGDDAEGEEEEPQVPLWVARLPMLSDLVPGTGRRGSQVDTGDLLGAGALEACLRGAVALVPLEPALGLAGLPLGGEDSPVTGPEARLAIENALWQGLRETRGDESAAEALVEEALLSDHPLPEDFERPLSLLHRLEGVWLDRQFELEEGRDPDRDRDKDQDVDRQLQEAVGRMPPEGRGTAQHDPPPTRGVLKGPEAKETSPQRDTSPLDKRVRFNVDLSPTQRTDPSTAAGEPALPSSKRMVSQVPALQPRRPPAKRKYTEGF